MLDDDEDALRERFMSGRCHALALHLHGLTGWPMVVLWLGGGRREELAHVMLMDPADADADISEATYLDAGGLRHLPEIMDDLEADEEEPRIEAVDEKGLRRLTSPRRASHRKLPELGADLMEEAGEAARTIHARIAPDGAGPAP